MLADILFPGMEMVRIADVEEAEQCLVIHITATTTTAVCPLCQVSSSRVHSHYYRFPHDLPCVGRNLQLKIRVRRFFCDNGQCTKRTFAEQFPSLLAVRARHTARLISRLKRVAYEISAESGHRLLAWLDIDCTADRLLRLVRSDDEPQVKTPRVLGVDDWAKRKGQTYGTILVDLENHKIVDLLPERSAASLSAWLTAHPGVEIISRDRGAEYIKGATEGAPKAIQVADRWHLFKNLRDALENMMLEKPECLQAAGDQGNDQGYAITADQAIVFTTIEQERNESDEDVRRPSTRAETLKLARRARKQERYELVRTLFQEGFSIRDIAKHLGIARQTVGKYIGADTCPFYTEGSQRSSKLDPFRNYLAQRWDDGCRNGSQLWREIQVKGFDGSRATVNRWATAERRKLPASERRTKRKQAEPKPSRPKPSVPWTAKRASWVLMKAEATLTDEEMKVLERIFKVDAQVAEAYTLVQAFQEIVRLREPERLQVWLEKLMACCNEALVTFGRGILQDLEAVKNAAQLPWSNGQTEGQVNQLKFIKRQMFGRAHFDLLRRRVLGCQPRQRLFT